LCRLVCGCQKFYICFILASARCLLGFHSQCAVPLRLVNAKEHLRQQVMCVCLLELGNFNSLLLFPLAARYSFDLKRISSKSLAAAKGKTEFCMHTCQKVCGEQQSTACGNWAIVQTAAGAKLMCRRSLCTHKRHMFLFSPDIQTGKCKLAAASNSDNT
jgi:hypothetical protein